MGTKTNSGPCPFSAGLAVGVAADLVHLRRRVACPTAAAVGFGQHSLLGVVQFFPVRGACQAERGEKQKNSEKKKSEGEVVVALKGAISALSMCREQRARSHPNCDAPVVFLSPLVWAC